jgi:DNA-binding GntR family transcriptional regulator
VPLAAPSDQPRTLVDQAARAILSAAARGEVLPDDRLVEADIARALGISRVPVREALRLLESQGVVVSIPYKGMRLMPVSNRSAGEIMRVRGALESLAIQEIAAAGAPEPMALAEGQGAAERYAEAVAGSDLGLIVAADEAFHAALCRMGGNAVLYAVWIGVARQLSVVWALGHTTRPYVRTVGEHRRILAAIVAGHFGAATETLLDHISWHGETDFEGEIARRRAARG